MEFPFTAKVADDSNFSNDHQASKIETNIKNLYTIEKVIARAKKMFFEENLF